MFTEKELRILNTHGFNEAAMLIDEHWNKEYGRIEYNLPILEESSTSTLELITGGWSENEALIEVLQGTLFWMLYWQESKRGGYHKFSSK